jgi:hypothetical protein
MLGGDSGYLRPMPDIVCDKEVFDWFAARGLLKHINFEIVRLV